MGGDSTQTGGNGENSGQTGKRSPQEGNEERILAEDPFFQEGKEE